ncbi:CRISPR-associated endonuclease Cas2 [Kitasatospora albolonga]|uniref:CRISPR-associated endonuclease Cas2 n=1 Tax=Kitasatospora albolonga TaxID=68173 RepID=UPI0031EF4C9B
MFVILVYDTAAERNPKVLKTCRRYLHWTQRSVFQGELTPAQYRALTSTLETVIDPTYDSIITYTTRSPDYINTATIGTHLGGPGDII